MTHAYNEKIGNKLCGMVAQGVSLITAIKSIGYDYSVVARWRAENEDFAKKLAFAREEQAEFLAEETIAIADNPAYTPEDKNQKIKARQWYTSKLKPQKFGDRTILAGDADNPLQLLASRLDKAIEASGKMIDVTPQPDIRRIEALPNIEDGSDLV